MINDKAGGIRFRVQPPEIDALRAERVELLREVVDAAWDYVFKMQFDQSTLYERLTAAGYGVKD